jgi:hypothetical protein
VANAELLRKKEYAFRRRAEIWRQRWKWAKQMEIRMEYTHKDYLGGWCM